jgi:hypothetical protein
MMRRETGIFDNENKRNVDRCRGQGTTIKILTQIKKMTALV